MTKKEAGLREPGLFRIAQRDDTVATLLRDHVESDHTV